ncbi:MULTISPECIES: chemotaxis protein MotC [Rhizobium]|uniref:Chemotaxis protein MotC n=1 Tax=Rhizobium paranaense TaxID=1650438 RepID=A0A7W8XL90_9HYPH|nr:MULTISPECIES: chemotaxis protein MotC [Rhizobium]MBB5571467.1 chemotaxis protein MotC [Rhizobium paranaense]PST64600.1 chemotaxis protein [Rhizobium sp. SEMIA4064]
MARIQHRHRLALALTLGMSMPGIAGAEDADSLPPYKMLRSLEFIQDSVVAGDSSAGEMQRFMLATIDERLRTADKSTFDDSRNVDAALIYAMSGGNPATLEFLMSRDLNGNFDNRVADVLRKYLNGKGLLVVNTLSDIAREYRDKKIGPYISLVAANVMSSKNPKAALKLYDWARLTSPGTIVEESALRRSLALCTDSGMVPEGLAYAQRYTRRFLHSPYASQFANLFVQLVVDHNAEVKQEDIVDILSFMDPPRQREIYLRMARRAAIAGKADLAALASGRAQAISNDGGDAFGALAGFYGGVAGVSTPELGTAVRNIDQMPAGELNVQDRALRDAAKVVADEILRAPDPSSLTQVSPLNLPNQDNTEHDAAVTKPPGAKPPGTAGVEEGAPAKAAPAPEEGRQEADSSFNAFVTTSRSKLDAIDGLLKQESH